MLQVLGGVRDRLPDLGGELLDRPLALVEDVDELGAAPVAQCFRDRGQTVEQGILGRPVTHTDPSRGVCPWAYLAPCTGCSRELLTSLAVPRHYSSVSLRWKVVLS